MSYEENLEEVKNSFNDAYQFIINLASEERTKLGYNIGTFKNLHFYHDDKFLFRIRFINEKILEFDYNKRSVPNKIDKSQTFYSLLKKIISKDESLNKFLKGKIIVLERNKDYFKVVDDTIRMYSSSLS